MMIPWKKWEYHVSSLENQKGIITVQRCSIENQKGTIAIDIVQW